FDSEFYVSRYHDIADAVQGGRLREPFDHYLRRGPVEQREAFAFDEAFYRTHYPQATIDVDAGEAPDLRTHFSEIGYYRGYLPNAKAERPVNPAAFASRFGGLWPDAGDALDKIAGRHEIGQITLHEADLLTHWAQHGYLVLEGAIPEHEIDA